MAFPQQAARHVAAKAPGGHFQDPSGCLLVACVLPLQATGPAGQSWVAPARRPSAPLVLPVPTTTHQAAPAAAASQPWVAMAQASPTSPTMPLQLLLQTSGQAQVVLPGSVGLPPQGPEAEAPLPGIQGLQGRVWPLSRECEGCRAVQEALESASGDAERQALAEELRGHVWQAMRHRHANHVLQKCITTLRPAAIQFILDELLAKGPTGTVRVAKHAFGCRILQRLFEHCRACQLALMAEHLLQDVPALARHVFGNFVLQHLLEYGTAPQQRRAMLELGACAPELGRDIHSGAVLTKAFSCGDREAQQALARAIVLDHGSLVAMARTRHGSAAAKRLLEAAEGELREEAQRQLGEDAVALRARRYGRSIVASLPTKQRAAAKAPTRGGA